MENDHASSDGFGICAGHEAAEAAERTVEVRRHPRRIQGLTRSLERREKELWEIRRTAIATLGKAIEGLASLDPHSGLEVAANILSELEGMLDELMPLDPHRLPRPEYLFATANRLKQLNGALAVATAEPGKLPEPGPVLDERPPANGAKVTALAPERC